MGLKNPKKNVWLNESIYPLNKPLLLEKSQKIEYSRGKPKKKEHLSTSVAGRIPVPRRTHE
jgi:hypothetical protein